MDLEQLREYALSRPGKVTEDFPFDEEVLVFRIAGKIFLLTNVNAVPLTANLKCDPARALELRERYPDVKPGFHMNKKMWNTVDLSGSLPDRIVKEMIDHSYDEVVKKLSVKEREKIVQKSGKSKKLKEKSGMKR
ncbi:MAG: MmcQ/YjbR family DNA-binding protein [Bacteroidetes bacterium]|nr:MmcQ/YjbR family DNA-binding protein [Bacteroidota bacterium]